MINDEMIFERLKGFIYSVRWKYRQSLTFETRLYEDLKIDGDDAIDFFLAFENEFNVDVSQFNLGKYFNGEGFDPIGLSKVFKMLKGQKETSSEKKISLNLGHLVKAIKEGHLNDEIITDHNSP